MRCAIPSPRLQKLLLAEGIFDPASMQKMHRAADAEVQAAADAALHAPFPEPNSYALHVYSENLTPTAKSFESAPVSEGGDRTMADLINTCLRDEMARDERIVIFGEDVADCSNEEYLEDKKLKGKAESSNSPPVCSAIRLRPRIQLAARRSQHRRPRPRHGHSRT